MTADFRTTRWSVVLAAGARSDRALATLCEAYWYPLYAFARRRTGSRERAEDLTQGFFAALLEKDWASAADPTRGRFRAEIGETVDSPEEVDAEIGHLLDALGGGA